ncbi:tyrosine-type recombinase/integrase, partial [Marinobacter sp. OP 3.4]|uniref:tyrosine-type recombinase/integrase n=1 Tax=Marinobacter sp. OP 3.4 TaxID=3076501 RepID=UPI002E230486
YPEVSGKSAREEAERLRKLASDGADLKTIKDQAKVKPTFKEAAEDWYSRKVAEGLAPKTLRLMRDALDKDMLPAIGSKALESVTRAECTQLQSKIEGRGAWHIAKKARGWMNQIFSLAIAQGKCDLNPASELRHVAKKAPQTQNHPHLHEPELPDFLNALSRSNSMYPTRVAVYMILLTASRPGMVRWAEWSEVDLDEQMWTIPGPKMKKRRDHLVPLPDQLIPLLRNLEEITGRGRYLYPGVKSNAVLSHTTVNAVLSNAGYKGKLTGHGSRHTASTLLREHGWRKDYVEMQLSHVEQGVAGVYNKAQYLKQRQVMMQWYSDYLDALKRGISEQDKEDFAKRVIKG